MRLTQRMVWLACLWPFLSATSYSQTLKKDYLTYIQQAAELGWQEYPGVIANWKKDRQTQSSLGLRRSSATHLSGRYPGVSLPAHP